jgi:hypothetical protein
MIAQSDMDRSAPDSAWTLAALLRLSVLVVGGIVALVALGPFNTYGAMTPFERTAFWACTLLGATCLFTPSLWLASQIGCARGWPAIVWAPASAAVAAVPATLLVQGLMVSLFSANQLEFARFYGFVFSVGLIMQGLSYALVFQWPRAHAPPQRRASEDGVGALPTLEKQTSAGAAFLDRLPRHLGADLLCLEMEDHYVRAHTRRGAALIHLRMSDAVAELADVDGLRVHRSWWVARSAVQSASRDGRNLSLFLPGGIVAPVSRAMQSVLKEAGWLDEALPAAQGVQPESGLGA